MKKLVLIRHAQAQYAPSGASDIERELSSSGISDTARAAHWISTKQLVPESIISSPAARTAKTIELICLHASFPSNIIRLDDRLYESSKGQYISVIAETDNRINTLFVVGHNFAISELLVELTGSSGLWMSPCTVALLSPGISSWADIELVGRADFELFHPQE